MNKSLKIGIISGLIAGFIYGIVVVITENILAKIGLPFGLFYYAMLEIAKIEIIFGIFWGIIFGIIYSKIYNVIPSEGIIKGLMFGLFLYFVTSIRIAIWIIPYAFYYVAFLYIISGILPWIAFGLMLGFLYESFHEEFNVSIDKKKIIQYDMKSGIIPGAIAGFLGGIPAFVSVVIGSILRLMTMLTPEYENWLDYLTDVPFLTSQFGTHAFMHMLWGAIFGAIFARVYNLVPKKGVIKGLIYGLIVLLITGLRYSFYQLIYGSIAVFWQWILPEVCAFITFGIVLGLLYRKPVK
jgi:hypothetical protein